MPPKINLKIDKDTILPIEELKFSYSRSSGPGGQNVNKVNSKATLRWQLHESLTLSEKQKTRIQIKLSAYINEDGEFVLSSDRTRSQHQNQEDVIEKLAVLLTNALKTPKKRKKTRKPRSATEARLKEKRKQSEKKRHRRLKD